MILLTSLHTLNPTAVVEAASIPPPAIVDWLLSINPHIQQIERCVLYTLVTAAQVDSASLNLSYLHHRLLVHSPTNILSDFRCSTYAAKTTLRIAHPSVSILIYNRSDNLRYANITRCRFVCLQYHCPVRRHQYRPQSPFLKNVSLVLRQTHRCVRQYPRAFPIFPVHPRLASTTL